MDIRVTPSLLHGQITVPPSKSISHRMLICAALAYGRSLLRNVLDCDDTAATAEALKTLGANIETSDGVTVVDGIKEPPATADIDCRESGSTLRFMIPIAAALGVKTTFRGRANLPNRPITPYLMEFPKHGVCFDTDKMPYTVSGRLKGGEFAVPGDISSQFITGYLLAAPLSGSDCVIRLTSELQSRPYATLTTDVMESFGVRVNTGDDSFTIPGSSRYIPHNCEVEGDMSQAAFFLVANCIGGNTEPTNLNNKSVQGDRVIIEITRDFMKNGGKAFDVDAENIPDLVPILTVLACFADGDSHITGCGRLRIKECDRLAAISTELNKLGANIKAGEDFLTIHGVKELHGGDCDTYSDHRIAMSLAIASQRCTAPIIIRGAECVSKSYPHFFKDFEQLGGKADVI